MTKSEFTKSSTSFADLRRMLQKEEGKKNTQDKTSSSALPEQRTVQNKELPVSAASSGTEKRGAPITEIPEPEQAKLEPWRDVFEDKYEQYGGEVERALAELREKGCKLVLHVNTTDDMEINSLFEHISQENSFTPLNVPDFDCDIEEETRKGNHGAIIAAFKRYKEKIQEILDQVSAKADDTPYVIQLPSSDIAHGLHEFFFATRRWPSSKKSAIALTEREGATVKLACDQSDSALEKAQKREFGMDYMGGTNIGIISGLDQKSGRGSIVPLSIWHRDNEAGAEEVKTQTTRRNVYTKKYPYEKLFSDMLKGTYFRSRVLRRKKEAYDRVSYKKYTYTHETPPSEFYRLGFSRHLAISMSKRIPYDVALFAPGNKMLYRTDELNRGHVEHENPKFRVNSVASYEEYCRLREIAEKIERYSNYGGKPVMVVATGTEEDEIGWFEENQDKPGGILRKKDIHRGKKPDVNYYAKPDDMKEIPPGLKEYTFDRLLVYKNDKGLVKTGTSVEYNHTKRRIDSGHEGVNNVHGLISPDKPGDTFYYYEEGTGWQECEQVLIEPRTVELGDGTQIREHNGKSIDYLIVGLRTKNTQKLIEDPRFLGTAGFDNFFTVRKAEPADMRLETVQVPTIKTSLDEESAISKMFGSRSEAFERMDLISTGGERAAEYDEPQIEYPKLPRESTKPLENRETISSEDIDTGEFGDLGLRSVRPYESDFAITEAYITDIVQNHPACPEWATDDSLVTRAFLYIRGDGEDAEYFAGISCRGETKLDPKRRFLVKLDKSELNPEYLLQIDESPNKYAPARTMKRYAFDMILSKREVRDNKESKQEMKNRLFDHTQCPEWVKEDEIAVERYEDMNTGVRYLSATEKKQKWTEYDKLRVFYVRDGVNRLHPLIRKQMDALDLTSEEWDQSFGAQNSSVTEIDERDIPEDERENLWKRILQHPKCPEWVTDNIKHDVYMHLSKIIDSEAGAYEANTGNTGVTFIAVGEWGIGSKKFLLKLENQPLEENG